MDTRRIHDIAKQIEKEFPADYALQQIHIARKLLAEEAKQQGMAFWEYIKKQAESAEVQRRSK